VGADNVVIDGNSLSLDGRNKSGYGVYLNNHTGVAIKNFTIKNYYYAMNIQNGSNITITNNNVSGNKGSNNTFLDLNVSIANSPGGGILFNNISASNISVNTGSYQDVGINLYNSNGNTISTNDFSNNTGWGIRLYQSSNNTISSNQAHHNNRCNNTGCDSAGILLAYSSNSNSIIGNNIIYSGNGFFIGNENGLPSNNNTVDSNDGSFSSNNCFEATFSQGNIFKNNTAKNCNYGFWLGFSHDSQLLNNIVSNNRTDGVYWESGRFGTVTGNTFSANARYGFAVTLSTNSSLIQRYPGSESSHDYNFTSNKITDNGTHGLFFSNTINSTAQNNGLSGNTNNIFFDGNSSGNTISQNNIECINLVTGKSCTYNAYNNMSIGINVAAANNWWGDASESAILSKIYDFHVDSSKGSVNYTPWLTAPLTL